MSLTTDTRRKMRILELQARADRLESFVRHDGYREMLDLLRARIEVLTSRLADETDIREWDRLHGQVAALRYIVGYPAEMDGALIQEILRVSQEQNRIAAGMVG